jgi:hypothetical protein
MDPLTVGASIATIIGAGIAVAAWISQAKAQKPRVEVKLQRAFFTHLDDREGLRDVFYLEAANVGERPVVLSGATLHLPEQRLSVEMIPGMWGAQGYIRLPHELVPGRNCSVWVEADKVVRGLRGQGISGQVKVVGTYRDQTGNEYRSKPLELAVPEQRT